MKKTISLALISLLLLSLSAMATEVEIPYEDWGCGWEEKCTNEWKCHGSGPHKVCGWEQECYNDWVCDTKDKETSIDVPETDLTPVNERLTTLESKGDKTGISRVDIGNWLMGDGMYFYGNDLKSIFDKNKKDHEYYEAKMLKLEAKIIALSSRIAELEAKC